MPALGPKALYVSYVDWISIYMKVVNGRGYYLGFEDHFFAGLVEWFPSIRASRPIDKPAVIFHK